MEALKSKRDMEIEEVKSELQKPLINGDKVLMCVMTLSLVSGEHGVKSEVTGFFDDGSNCSCIKNSTAERLGLWGHPITLKLGAVNATTSIETKFFWVSLGKLSTFVFVMLLCFFSVMWLLLFVWWW